MRPLEGLLVVALEQAVAGPMCSRRLADAGARVIKLERPGGDFARGYDDVVHGESSYFAWLNRGKASVVVDLTAADDRKLFEALIAKADVFIQNLKPGALERLDLSIATLRKRNPGLIACSIVGYGAATPDRNRKAYDLLIQAEAGLAGVTGEPERPARIGVSIVDTGTGMHAYEAILEALIARGRTGDGCAIVVSMFDAMAEWMSVPLLHGRHGTAPKRQGLQHPSVAPYGVFTCADGSPILISIQNDREWRTFAAHILGDATLGDDPTLATNVARVANRDRTDGLVADVFAALTFDDIAARLNIAEIAYGRVSSVADVWEHTALTTTLLACANGDTAVPARPVTFDGERAPAGSTIPTLGADTEKVRREFQSTSGVGPSE
ncbi:MAG: CaiB/BaiF CoA-transferase family protein [Pseudomonadota bacterium]